MEQCKQVSWVGAGHLVEGWLYSVVPLPQTLHSIVHNGEPAEVLELASAASQCMKEVSVGMETRDFRQPLADRNSEGV